MAAAVPAVSAFNGGVVETRYRVQVELPEGFSLVGDQMLEALTKRPNTIPRPRLGLSSSNFGALVFFFFSSGNPISPGLYARLCADFPTVSGILVRVEEVGGVILVQG